MNINGKAKKENQFDAIVIGSGISGGWAIKELTEKGLKVLLLERGRMIKHGDYPMSNLDKWEVPNRGKLSSEDLKDYKIQSKPGYNMDQFTKDFWVKDTEHPYNQIKPFDWIRGYQMGGRSLVWGRQTYRLSDLDFEANAKEGITIDWPIRYKDLAPWYDHVESYIGVSGQKEGLAQVPDGVFQKPMELNCIEKHVKERIAKNYSDRLLTIGRVAHITKEGGHMGRGTCMTRNRCMRGCPLGAYFSSNASTIPAAEKTGNLTIRPFSIAHSIIFDSESQKAVGVNIIDSENKSTLQFYSKIIFLNASTLNSAAILLNSKSSRFPNGMGNDSGQLGHNIMDHHFLIGATGRYDGYKEMYYKGRRPNGIYVPRFRNIDSRTKQKEFLRGYQYQGGGKRESWWRTSEEEKFGAKFKDRLIEPGDWTMSLHGFGECLPYHDNKMSLNYNKPDEWGLPTLDLDVEWKDNEKAMRKDMEQQAIEMLESSGLKDVQRFEFPCVPGLGIHEMGTARMGNDPKHSVLNKWNQIHAVKNVFLTDGSCMTSSACQNPSLSYMALTARAVDHAVKELNKRNL